ncbi:MAG: RNA polymerase sigma factor [Acidimicrobiia bacterium]
MSRPSTIVQQADRDQRFDPLFRAHHDAIWRYCLRRLGPSDADDAAADVFAVVWRRLDEMPTGEASRAWLYGVAYRVVGSHYRSRRRQTRLTARLDASTRGEGHQLFEPVPSHEVQLLLRALDGLSPTDRELLRLSVWEGLTRDEIAYVLGIKVNTVDQRLHRARSRLKVRFDRLGSGPAPTEPEEASA